MEYWFYENYPKKYVCLHFSDCADCNSGKGKEFTNLPENGRWHGPFDNAAEAEDGMRCAVGKVRRKCKHCSP